MFFVCIGCYGKTEEDAQERILFTNEICTMLDFRIKFFEEWRQNSCKIYENIIKFEEKYFNAHMIYKYSYEKIRHVYILQDNSVLFPIVLKSAPKEMILFDEFCRVHGDLKLDHEYDTTNDCIRLHIYDC